MAISLKTSPGLRMLMLGMLALIMLIPLLHVRGLINERQQRAYEVEQSIAAQWGAAQTLAGAYLTFTNPAPAVNADPRIATPPQPSTHVLLADALDVDVTLKPERRYRGMFEVPVYTAEVTVQARFAHADLRPFLQRAMGTPTTSLRLGLSDTRGLRALSDLEVNGIAMRAAAQRYLVSGMHGIGVDLPADMLSAPEGLSLHYTMTIAGVRALDFLPFARTTTVRVAGNWNAPDFQGAYLPRTRQVDTGKFDAQWQVLELNRELPQWWVAEETPDHTVTSSAFGVNLFQPANVYQQNERSGKYGILVVALLFVAMFLFEMIGGVQLHPIQYLFIGLALAVFYLLLLALSEHVGFSWAYLIAATAAVAVVAGYLRAVMRSRQRALLVAAMQAGAYAVFFVLVRSEDYALLLGATVLFVALALVMYLTRHVEWQNMARQSV
jgi:inner membrane protein